MRAFSLVELSIVLVILGLLTGGILAGQSLIRAAEVRSVTTGFQKYQAAIYTFRDKYMNLPGDTNNAVNFWLSAGGNGADSTCYMAQTSSSPATCNGDGDGLIQNGPAANAERFLSWKHLANAGLIEGSYTGKTAGAAGTSSYAPGTNVSQGRINNSFFDLFYNSNNPSFWITGSAVGNAIHTYGPSSSNYGFLAPEEAWNIDTKLDDGNPVYGAIFTTKRTSATGPNCVTTDTTSAVYDLQNTSKTCLLALVLR